MLTTNKTSRLRLVSGCAAVAMLTVAGLGVTASGTQAAERVRSGVEKATGVSLAELNPIAAVAPLVSVAPAAVPAVPSVPALGAIPAPMPMQEISAAPVASPAPPAPPAPPVWGDDEDGVTTTVSPDGKVTKRKVVRIVRRDKDGKMTTEDFRGMGAMPPMPPMRPMPEISSRNCPGDGQRHETVINEKKGDKRIIIICTNRIEKIAREGAAMAARSKDIERNAYRSALEGLRNAQARMRSDQAMGEVARNEAIRAIDEAIRDMEENIAKAN